MAEAARLPKVPLREGEQRLDRAASVLDTSTDISFPEALRIFARVISYFRLFKARIATKLGFITVELGFRLLVAPWPGKVVVDHVILGVPIADASGFPAYLAPFVLLLDGMGPVETMVWILLLGVFMVAVFGFTTSRGAGRSPSGAPTGTSAGSSGGATVLTPQGHGTLAQGHDIATQTENQANMGSGLMAGILGVLDFRVHIRLMQSLNHLLRTEVAAKLKSLPMTTLDDLRIGDSVFRALYDTTSVSALLHGIALGLYSGVLGVVITLYIMFTYFGAAPEVIVLGMLALPIVFLIELPFARIARRRSQASRASGSSTTSNIEEGMSNVLAVQSLGGNERESRRFRQASAESFKRFRTEWFVVLTYQQFFSLALMLSQVLFFIVMAGRVIDGTFTAGDYFVLTYYFFVLSATFGAWGFMYTEWQRDIAGMRRVFFLMDLPAERSRGGVELPTIVRGVEMKESGSSTRTAAARSATSTWKPASARSSLSSARPAPARRASPTWCPPSFRPRRARCRSTVSTSRTCRSTVSGTTCPTSSRRRNSSPTPSSRTSATATGTRPRPRSSARRALPAHTTSSPHFPTATAPTSAR